MFDMGKQNAQQTRESECAIEYEYRIVFWVDVRLPCEGHVFDNPCAAQAVAEEIVQQWRGIHGGSGRVGMEKQSETYLSDRWSAEQV